MAGDDGRGRRTRQIAAVILVLCALAQFTTCVSLQGLSNVKQDEVDSGATVMDERTGRVFLNGKELNSQTESAFSTATENDGLLHTDVDQLKSTGPLEQTSQQGDNMAEAAWRRMTVFLHCGQRQMKIKAMGPEAVNLKLDMGNAPPLPLFQVPEHCGFSMRQNALGFVLVVPYGGCNVMQEDESFVFPMSWLETSVKFTCPMSGSSTTPPPTTTPKPAHQPRKLPFSLRPWGLNRRKRQLTQPLSIYDPNLYMYYYNMMTTTAEPTTTTTKPPSVQPLPSYQYSYDPYLYYYYYYYNYYPQYFPMQTTTAKPTTASTTKTTPKPGPDTDDTDVYYYPIIQHFYGSPPYTQKPQTTPPTSPTTTKPGDTTPETTPTTTETTPTEKPTTATTTKPTTTPTTKVCSTTTTAATTTAATTAATTKASDVYPGPMQPLVSYYQNPFPLQVAYNRAGKLPDDQKYMPQYGFKSGLEAQANPHPGFQYWQPVNWLQQTGNPQ